MILRLLLAAACCTAPGPDAVPQSDGPGTYAISPVTVVPMDRPGVLPDRTVIVAEGRITAVGPAGDLPIPADAERIPGGGRFLIPGLCDMHAHLQSDYDLPDELGGDELFVMLANGVTTARLMIGTPEHLELRREIAAGRIVGPRLFVASPQLSGVSWGEHFHGYEVRDAEAAREAVRRSVAAGYDFIKLTFRITPPVYDAAVDEAARLGVRVTGHVGHPVGLQRALEAGQQIEHLDEYLEALLAEDAPMRTSVSGSSIWRAPAWRSLDWIDESKIPEVVEATVAAGVWNTPTSEFLHRSFALGVPDEYLATRPGVRFFPPWRRAEMEELRSRYWDDPPPAEKRKRFVTLRNRLIRALHEGGARLMVGSDAPEWWLLYGFGVHLEMQALAEAGLPTQAVLAAATCDPAEFLGILDETGTVQQGKVADLVLLEGDPLEDIRNTRRIAGVFVRGRWFPAEHNAERLDEIAAAFQAVPAPQPAAPESAAETKDD